MAGLAAAAEAGTGKWIVGETTGCGTSNPFFTPGERIRWHGTCADGKLHGYGTLIWIQDDRETERNVGNFRAGEFHGEVLTTYPDGQAIYGRYVDGRRDGTFVIIRIDGSHVEASYRDGTLVSQREMTTAAAATWRRQREAAVAGGIASATAPASVPAPVETGRTEEEDEGFFSGWGLGDWNVLDRMTGWFGFDDDAGDSRLPPLAPLAPVPAASPSTAAPAPVTTAAPAPVTAAAGTRATLASNSAERLETAYVPTPAIVRAPAVSVPAPAGAIPAPSAAIALGGDWYDMEIFLNESHPFANMPSAKASIPIVGWPIHNAVVVAAPSHPAVGVPPAAPNAVVTQPPAQLAGGWLTPAFAIPAPPITAPPNARTGADELFRQAYRLERSGRQNEAQHLYEQVIMTYPSAPSAMLANARLGDLMRPSVPFAAASSAPVPIEPEVTVRRVPIGEQKVVAVNSPVPAGAGLPREAGRERVAGLVGESPDQHRAVCTRDGLYEDGAKWCGVVRRVEGEYYRVEVSDVHVKRFGVIGISRSVCSGGAFINWFSRGTLVRVPKDCMTFTG